jgi:S1-C subfamily serine protease
VTRLLLALALLAATGCASPRRPLEPLPIQVSAKESWLLAPAPLKPIDLADRAQNAVVYIELDQHAVKSFREYAHDVGQSFLGMIVSPFTAPLFLAELFFGWLDFSTTWGTGFIVDATGHVVTNAHVVGEDPEVNVARGDGTTVWRAQVVAVDQSRDLALLHLKDVTFPRAEVAALGTSSDVKLGQEIVIYGFPKRPFPVQGYVPKPTITHGIISSAGIESGEAAPRFQLDAPANGGASGSPVLDEHGAVIGVVTEVADPSSFEGQTFAIPIDDVVKAFFKRGDDRGNPH